MDEQAINDCRYLKQASYDSGGTTGSSSGSMFPQSSALNSTAGGLSGTAGNIISNLVGQSRPEVLHVRTSLCSSQHTTNGERLFHLLSRWPYLQSRR